MKHKSGSHGDNRVQRLQGFQHSRSYESLIDQRLFQNGAGSSNSALDTASERAPTSAAQESRGGPLLRAGKPSGGPLLLFEVPVEVQMQTSLGRGEREGVVGRMHAEFRARRKMVLSGLPPHCSEKALNSFLKDYSCTAVSKIKDCSVKVLFPDTSQAKAGIVLLNSAHLEGHKLSASFGHPDSLLFVGNLPYSHTSQDLMRLFKPLGEILRCFVVCSPQTGHSKGYGFVEFATREEALQAKQQMATRVVGLRGLRVDFADNGMQTCEDLQSRTLFVDRLPKGFKDDNALRQLFGKHGTVNFCQVALAPNSGNSRGFAFIDMSTSGEAERAQVSYNGTTFAGQEIRVSFGMPCRPGACILQHKNTVPLHFNPVSKVVVSASTFSSVKENLPLLYTPFMKSAAPATASSTSLYGEQGHSDDGILKSLPTTTLVLPKPQQPPPPPEVKSSSGVGALVKAHSLTQLSFPQTVNPVSPSLSAPSLASLPPPTTTTHSHTHTLVFAGGVPRSTQQPEKNSMPGGVLNHLRPVTGFKQEEVQNHSNTTSSILVPPSRGRKRPAPDTESFLVDPETLMGVYDKPYIGQHQQGIPYTHPLKRIRMEL